MPLTKENFSYATFLSADFGDSIGSGFKLSHLGKEFIITAKHVICDDQNTYKTDLLVTSQNYIGLKSDSHSISLDLKKSTIKDFGVSDLVIIELENDNLEISQQGNNIISATLDDLKVFKEIQIASNVILVGFPTSLIIDNFFDIDRPLLRAGIVAGINETSSTFIIDSPAFYGNSGGPILQLGENGEFHIIGIVSKYVPFVTEWKNKHERAFSRQEFYNSGYAICLPLDEIVDFVKSLN